LQQQTAFRQEAATVRSRAMTRRRLHLIAVLAAYASGVFDVRAQQRRPGGTPLRLGAERVLVDVGFTHT
jgi:hypothetical protein